MEREYFFVMLAGVLSGFIVFGGRVFSEMGLSLYQISVFHALFIFLFLPFICLKKYRIRKGMLRLFIAFGFLNALSTFAEFGPVVMGVPVAITTLLLYTQPLWTVLLGKMVLKEPITRTKAFAVVMVLAGVAFVANPLSVAGAGTLPGIILAAFGGILLSCWVIFGRTTGLRKYNPVTTQFGYTIFTLLFLMLSYPIAGMFISDAAIMSLSTALPISIWLYLMAFSVFAIYLAHILYFSGARKVAASTAGILLLLEPVVAAILAAIFLRQPITIYIVIGGALILLSNWLVMRGE